MGVIVVGSANVDVLIAVDEFPRAGETLISRGVRSSFGGKGLNQAIAAVATGVPCRFVARVGQDADGERLRAFLAGRGVDVDAVEAVDGPSGAAYVMQSPDGQNAIVVASGANGRLDVPSVEAALAGCGAGDVVVVQGEIPAESSQAAVLTAAAAGARALVNLAPVIPFATDALALADPLVVNEHEAARLLGVEASEVVAHAEDAVARLLDVVRSVVITLGAAGAVARPAGGPAVRLPSPPVDRVVDSTGAGDAFVGVLAACRSLGQGLVPAAEAAVRAATESVRHAGTAETYPDFSRFARW